MFRTAAHECRVACRVLAAAVSGRHHRRCASSAAPEADAFDLFDLVDSVAADAALTPSVPSKLPRYATAAAVTHSGAGDALHTQQDGAASELALLSNALASADAVDVAMATADILALPRGENAPLERSLANDAVVQSIVSGACVKDPELISGHDLSRDAITLRGVKLPGNYGLARVDFSGAVFDRVTAEKKCGLTRCTFARVRFINCSFDGVRFGGSVFHKCSFEGTTRFVGCSFALCAFNACTFPGGATRVTFERCDFDMSELRVSAAIGARRKQEAAWSNAVREPRNWGTCMRSGG